MFLHLLFHYQISPKSPPTLEIRGPPRLLRLLQYSRVWHLDAVERPGGCVLGRTEDMGDPRRDREGLRGEEGLAVD